MWPQLAGYIHFNNWLIKRRVIIPIPFIRTEIYHRLTASVACMEIPNVCADDLNTYVVKNRISSHQF